MRLIKYWMMLILVGLLVTIPAQAQSNPTVYAVLFYSTTCPHCHQVINQDLPPLQSQYGEQLQVLFVNVRTSEGLQMMRDACQIYAVPTERCGSVPMMVIGSSVLIGSVQIPTELPQLVTNGLAAGGLGIPPIPGLYEAVVEQIQATQNTTNAVSLTAVEELTWRERFTDDWIANTFAIVITLLLTISLLFQLNTGWRVYTTHRVPKRRADRTWRIVFALAIVTVLLSISLIFEQEGLSLVLAMGVVGLLALVTALLWRAKLEKRTLSAEPIIPLLAVGGLLVAGYLAYVETGNNEAVCGAVGNCNTVQQSEYATFLGLVPIGILGVIGYVFILIGWRLTQLRRQAIAQYAQLGLLGLTLVGVMFSVYLTFLEPFVIGASCVWCLTSALLMLMLLWLQAPLGWRVLSQWFKARPLAR